LSNIEWIRPLGKNQLLHFTTVENIQSKLWFSGPFVPLFGSKILKKCCCKWKVVFCNLSQLYNRECMKQILFRNIFKLNVLLVIYKLFNELGSWVLQDRSLPSLCFKTWTTVRCTLYMPKWMAYYYKPFTVITFVEIIAAMK
jgi:hypothetical protein